MDVSVLTGVFMLLSCPGCHGIQCLQIFDKNEKKKDFKIHLQIHLFIHSQLLNLEVAWSTKENNGGKKLYGVNIRAIHRYTQVGADYLIEIVLLFEYAWAYALKILPKQFSSNERVC